MSEGGGRLCRSVSLLTTTTCIIVEGQGCSSFLFVVFNPLSAVWLLLCWVGSSTWAVFSGGYYDLLRYTLLLLSVWIFEDERVTSDELDLDLKRRRQDKTEQETV
jgi:hypothetical protein